MSPMEAPPDDSQRGAMNPVLPQNAPCRQEAAQPDTNPIVLLGPPGVLSPPTILQTLGLKVLLI